MHPAPGQVLVASACRHGCSFSKVAKGHENRIATPVDRQLSEWKAGRRSDPKQWAGRADNRSLHRPQPSGPSYGAAGSLIVLLTWIYYSAQIFLLGNASDRTHGPGETPSRRCALAAHR